MVVHFVFRSRVNCTKSRVILKNSSCYYISNNLFKILVCLRFQVFGRLFLGKKHNSKSSVCLVLRGDKKHYSSQINMHKMLIIY